MKLLYEIGVKSPVELSYAKITLKNLLRKNHKKEDESFLEHTLMELGVNLYKHANGGKIWIIETNGKIGIVALDKGSGIENITWALKQGTSTIKNSLGVGLYSLTQNSEYSFHICSFTKNSSSFHGTVALLLPKDKKLHKTLFSLSFTKSGNGDFFAQKGRLYFFGDVAGHGLMAEKWAKIIIKNFYETTISCFVVDSFYRQIHQKIQNEDGRGFVGALIEENQQIWNLCGIGNVTIFKNDLKDVTIYRFQDGVVGEAIRNIETKKIFRSNSKLIVTTDGIDDRSAYEILKKMPYDTDIRVTAISLIWFAGLNDDRSVLILK